MGEGDRGGPLLRPPAGDRAQGREAGKRPHRQGRSAARDGLRPREARGCGRLEAGSDAHRFRGHPRDATVHEPRADARRAERRGAERSVLARRRDVRAPGRDASLRRHRHALAAQRGGGAGPRAADLLEPAHPLRPRDHLPEGPGERPRASLPVDRGPRGGHRALPRRRADRRPARDRPLPPLEEGRPPQGGRPGRRGRTCARPGIGRLRGRGALPPRASHGAGPRPRHAREPGDGGRARPGARRQGRAGEVVRRLDRVLPLGRPDGHPSRHGGRLLRCEHPSRTAARPDGRGVGGGPRLHGRHGEGLRIAGDHVGPRRLGAPPGGVPRGGRGLDGEGDRARSRCPLRRPPSRGRPLRRLPRRPTAPRDLDRRRGGPEAGPAARRGARDAAATRGGAPAPGAGGPRPGLGEPRDPAVPRRAGGHARHAAGRLRGGGEGPLPGARGTRPPMDGDLAPPRARTRAVPVDGPGRRQAGPREGRPGPPRRRGGLE